MKFQVRWEDVALNELAAFWIQADPSLREEITAATSRVDQEFQINPYGLGESRSGGRRVFFLAPLGVLYRVERDEKTVSVLHVWLFNRRGS